MIIPVSPIRFTLKFLESTTQWTTDARMAAGSGKDNCNYFAAIIHYNICVYIMCARILRPQKATYDCRINDQIIRRKL